MMLKKPQSDEISDTINMIDILLFVIQKADINNLNLCLNFE